MYRRLNHTLQDHFNTDLSFRSDLILGLLSWFGSDQLQQTVFVEDLGAEALRLRNARNKTMEQNVSRVCGKNRG